MSWFRGLGAFGVERSSGRFFARAAAVAPSPLAFSPLLIDSPDVRADLELLRVDLVGDVREVLDAPLCLVLVSVVGKGEVGVVSGRWAMGSSSSSSQRQRFESPSLTLYVPVMGLPPSSSSPRSLASTMSVLWGCVGLVGWLRVKWGRA